METSILRFLSVGWVKNFSIALSLKIRTLNSAGTNAVYYFWPGKS